MIKIGITHGDINGIGYEVIMKALADDRITELCTPVIFGSAKLIGYYRKVLGTDSFSANQITTAEKARDGAVNLVNITSEELKVDMGRPTEESGKAAFLSLQKGVEALRRGEIDALVTAPICKQCIHSEEFAMGHTEYLQRQFGGEDDRALMILFNDVMRIAVATTHLALKDIPGTITQKLVAEKIEDLHKALTQDFGIDGPKIAVLSLNPHAGDGGLLGNEEAEIIAPAIKEATAKGILAFGPFAADGLFGSGSWRLYDGILAMYHDQGLAPFKLLAGDNAVNFTAGLPVIRTSPDFGTAFDIAGANKADASGMRTAIYAAIDLLRTRRRHLRAAANPLRKSYVERGADKTVDLSKETE